MSLLPIDAILPDLQSALENDRNVVLSADPGAGKTTRVPLALLDEPWLSNKKIIMLEPRRLAAQRAAVFMAGQLGERVGETVGYRIRGESRIGKRTRVEVVTEGILTRFLQSDPTLPDVALIIFDEFHERSIHADLGLVLTLNVQEHLRSDLRILVMSATLDGVGVASFLGDARVLQSTGRAYPVTTHYLERMPEHPIEPQTVATILRALREEAGDILVFLPGQREIRRVESLLIDKELSPNVDVHMLFGDAQPEKQRAALVPAPPGRRKVILSTSVAETSLTIDGVCVVVDSGLARSARFDPRRGMSGLVTAPVSQASADQRRGRAGRQQPGACYRLWTEHQHNQLPKFASPEILVADLAPLALELARWGTPEGKNLRFLDRPPAVHLAQARGLLTRLGALDNEGRLTKHGHAMTELPIHPRLAHMLLRGKELGLGTLACDIAALLEERDVLRGTHDYDIDLHSRWFSLRKGTVRDTLVRDRICAQASRFRELIGVNDTVQSDHRLGILLALAYPERIAKRRDEQGVRYQLSGGAGALLPKGSMLSRDQYLAVADVDGVGSEVKVFLAEPLTEDDIIQVFHDQLSTIEDIRWDERQEAVVARRVTRLGVIELSETPLSLSNKEVKAKMIDGIRMMRIDTLPWRTHEISIRTRSEWLRASRLVASDWPNLGDEHLMNTLDEWLGPCLDGIMKRSQLARLDMSTLMNALLSYEQLHHVDRLAPTHLVVPTGSRIPVEYGAGVQPVLAVRLQEMFGQTETPTVGGGKVKVVLHLLSPAHRPLAVTQDLPSFWKNAYPDVRKDMRGRYPKHHWPENPLEAKPTKRTKHRAR
ncbi:MAG: ATP-dependent helicase HrpB [Ignavibacteriae bacterium]|nr:ATP-dependent helicase HrpB [Ignavibacteria bacterium]MBI3365731.1 ATP-dependent helicase HrpB [Ignavibacteriota bacterium]